MKQANKALIILLSVLVIAGCSGGKPQSEIKATPTPEYTETIEHYKEEQYEKPSEHLEEGNQAVESWNNWRGKKIVVHFYKDPKPNFSPGFRYEAIATYDATKSDEPVVTLEINKTCIKGCNQYVKDVRSVVYFGNETAFSNDAVCMNKNPKQCFEALDLTYSLKRSYVKSVVLRENDDRLKSQYDFVGEEEYRGIQARKFKSRFSDTYIYTYKDLIVVGEEPANKIYWLDIPWKNPTFIEVREE